MSFSRRRRKSRNPERLPCRTRRVRDECRQCFAAGSAAVDAGLAERRVADTIRAMRRETDVGRRFEAECSPLVAGAQEPCCALVVRVAVSHPHLQGHCAVQVSKVPLSGQPSPVAGKRNRRTSSTFTARPALAHLKSDPDLVAVRIESRGETFHAIAAPIRHFERQRVRRERHGIRLPIELHDLHGDRPRGRRRIGDGCRQREFVPAFDIEEGALETTAGDEPCNRLP